MPILPLVSKPKRNWKDFLRKIFAKKHLNKSSVAERVSRRLQQQDKSLWQKIKDYFSGLVERLKKAYKDMEPDSKIAQQTREVIAQNEKILDAYVNAVADAVESYNNQNGQKNNAQEGEVRNSNRNTGYDYTKPFADQVDDWIMGKIPARDTLVVGETPEIFRRIGFNALPVTINQKHVDYAVNGTKNQEHHIGVTMLKQLPSALTRPVAVIASQTQNSNSVVALLPFQKNGDTVIVPVSVDGFGVQNSIRIDSNAITSIYGRKNAVSSLLTNAIQQHNNGATTVFYLDTEKVATLYQGARVTMPKVPNTSNDFVASITDVNSPVKTKLGSVTESQQFKRWFGDWQNNPENASKVVNEDGTPKIVYHQTGNLFTVFDTKREGAGSRDEGTPYGIFLKSSNADIGLGGKFQMGLYADIKNPLYADNRDTLRYKIAQMSDSYNTLIAEHDLIDAEYKGKVDNAIKELREFIQEWRAENPDASRRALYDVPRFNELFEAEDVITDEWGKKIAEVSSKAKAAMTKALEKNGYDGVFLTEDAGSFGRKTDAYIALRPEQVKSATDNVGTFDASNPDIRYSSRNLEAQNQQTVEESQQTIAAEEHAQRIAEIQEATKQALLAYQAQRAFEMDAARLQYEAAMAKIRQAHEQEMKELKAIYGESAVYQQEFIDHIEFVESNGKNPDHPVAQVVGGKETICWNSWDHMLCKLFRAS